MLGRLAVLLFGLLGLGTLAGWFWSMLSAERAERLAARRPLGALERELDQLSRLPARHQPAQLADLLAELLAFAAEGGAGFGLTVEPALADGDFVPFDSLLKPTVWPGIQRLEVTLGLADWTYPGVVGFLGALVERFPVRLEQVVLGAGPGRLRLALYGEA